MPSINIVFMLPPAPLTLTLTRGREGVKIGFLLQLVARKGNEWATDEIVNIFIGLAILVC
jgi:hypothetical protein